MTTDASYSLDRMLPGVLHNALNGGRCRSCGRRTEDMIIGHDGFCPVPALTMAIARIAADRAALAQAQAERGAATRRAEQAEAPAERLVVFLEKAINDHRDAVYLTCPDDCWCHEADSVIAAVHRAALAGQEGGPR